MEQPLLPSRALVEEALVAFSDQRMLHGERRRRAVAMAASGPTDASRPGRNA